MQAIPMTLRGAEKLREELDFLKSVRRPEIIAAIAEAREHGDLKENAEYHAAREQQGFCEGRIKDIEAKLSNAQVIDITKMPNNGRVIFGSTVSVLNLDNDEEQTYRIVGDDEADFKQNLISVNSPIARGLIGKEQDDVVTIRTPGGEVEYEIIKVEYLKVASLLRCLYIVKKRKTPHSGLLSTQGAWHFARLLKEIPRFTQKMCSIQDILNVAARFCAL